MYTVLKMEWLATRPSRGIHPCQGQSIRMRLRIYGLKLQVSLQVPILPLITLSHLNWLSLGDLKHGSKY